MRKLLASRDFIYHSINWTKREKLAPSEYNKDTFFNMAFPLGRNTNMKKL